MPCMDAWQSCISGVFGESIPKSKGKKNRSGKGQERSQEEARAQKLRSPTQIIMDNLIFKTDRRKTRKPRTKPELTQTFNYTATLADSMWLRRRARRKP
ncbi:NinE family protein [Serratia ureilytica]|uniref:NinE family protein n=1 Tax=Serratia ureilytica TaxID=300181 RepID=UPI002F965920